MNAVERPPDFLTRIVRDNQPDGGVQLIDRAVSSDAHGAFLDFLAAAESCPAVIAGPGVNFGDPHGHLISVKAQGLNAFPGRKSL